MRVKDVMTRQVVSVLPQATLAQAIDVMMRSNVSGLPVVGENGSCSASSAKAIYCAVRKLAQKDRGQAGSNLFRPDHTAQAYAHSHGRRVDEIMTTNVVSVGEYERLEDAARLLQQHDIKRLPVIRDDKVVGIISRADFVRALAGFVRPSYEDQPVRDQAIKAAIEQSSRPSLGPRSEWLG